MVGAAPFTKQTRNDVEKKISDQYYPINFSSISMKHTNRQLTIIDVVVVQAMSRKVVISDPNIMQLHCPTSLAMSKRWEHVINITRITIQQWQYYIYCSIIYWYSYY